MLTVTLALSGSGCAYLAPKPATPAPPPTSGIAASSATSSPADSALPAIDARLSPARDALLREDYPAALKLCRQARARGASLPDSLMLEAEIMQAASYMDREMDALERWTQAAPQDPAPWRRLFSLYLALGWKREAGQASAEAARLAPESPQSQVARAAFGLRFGGTEESLSAIRKARELAPDNIEYMSLHASLLSGMQRYSEAETILRGMIARDPRNAAYRLSLAQILLQQKKTEEAAALLKQIQQEEPGNLEAAYELGVVAEKQGDLAEAVRQLETVIVKEPQYSNAAWRLGRIYIQQGRIEEGRRLQKQFREMDTNTKNYDTAMRRVGSHPDSPEAHTRKAQLHLEAEELPQAIVELRRALELRPADAGIRRKLVVALRQNGRFTESEQLASASPIRKSP